MSARNVRATAAGLLLAAAATGIITAYPANADATTTDNAAFLEHVHALGFTGDSDLINAGQKLCDAMGNGVSLAMVQAISENTLTAKGYSISDADRFVGYVVADVCA